MDTRKQPSRFLAILLCVCMVLTMLPAGSITAFAAGEETVISSDTTWEAQAISNDVRIESGATLTINGQIIINDEVTISGGGTIARGDGAAYFNIGSGVSLTLDGVTVDGKNISSDNSMFQVYGTLDIKNSTVQNCVKNISRGGAINVDDGTLTIENTLLNAVGLNVADRVGGSVQFFIYDTIKIMVLLGVLILIISYIQSYFPPERTKKILGRFHGIGANCIAALLGTVTPFCSCSSIPLFIGFTSAGLPLGVTFSFLISSPMVDLGSLVLLMSIFGWKVAVTYVVLGLVIAVIGGTLIEKLHLENYVEEYIRKGNTIDLPQDELHFKDRLKYAWEQVLATAKKVAPYVLIGVGIGAFIHNWIPEDFIVKVLGTGNPFGVILATIAGVPMYADIFGTIPIAEALLAKGAQLGVALSFMMGVTTLSLPSMIMLRKAVKPKLLGIFVAICTIGIILVGYFFNAIQYLIV